MSKYGLRHKGEATGLGCYSGWGRIWGDFLGWGWGGLEFLLVSQEGTQSFLQIPQTEEERGTLGSEICQQSKVTNGIRIFTTSDKDTKETLRMEEAIEIYEQIK